MTVITVVPAFITALYGLARTNNVAPNIFDGYGVSADPGNSLNIGIDAPMASGPASSANSSQEWANANYGARKEEGSVTCAAYAWSGNGDDDGSGMGATREAAFAIVNALAALVHADPTLGIDGLLWCGVTSVDVQQDQNDDGAEALVTFRISFRALLF